MFPLAAPASAADSTRASRTAKAAKALKPRIVRVQPDPGTENHHDGNGHHNRNIISTRSPTHNHGYQHTNNSNAGGSNPVQNALCRHVTVCTINQKVTIIQPERTVPPTPGTPALATPVLARPVLARPALARPAVVPATPVRAVPLTVLPQSTPAARPVERPRHRPVKGPFMYMGPDGFLMMAPDSATPAAFGASAAGEFQFPAGLHG